MSGESDTKAAVIVGMLTVPTLLAIVAFGAVWGGFVLSTLWNWFGLPLTAYRLALPEAIGLSCIYSFLTARFVQERPADEESNWSRIFGKMLVWPLLLLIGFVAHLFMGAR